MIRILLAMPLIMVLFQNCSDSGVSFGQVSPLSEAELGDLNNVLDNTNDQGAIEVIRDRCTNLSSTVVQTTLVFPKPQKTCEWGQDGNLSKKDGYFRARIEQVRKLDLPRGAVICNAQFEFAQQDFLYDDHFMLLFNSSVIAASYDFSGQFSRGRFDLLNYSWLDMAGMEWNRAREEIFCPQIPGMTSHCAFPGHDQQGVINLTYGDDFIQAIMANGIPSEHSFSLISVGDNDRKDCEHSEVSFDLTIRYAL